MTQPPASATSSESAESAEPTEPLSGEIAVDGSSTVYPITEAVAEEFQLANPDVRISVAFSGTGGGFKKFCAGETDANDASRPIKTADKPGPDGVMGTADDEKSEATKCSEAGVTPVELQVAFDGLAVIVNPRNDWVDCLTTDQLTAIWDQGSTVGTWSEVDPSWPAEPLNLYGPGADSGTFDYFTEVINGETDRSRADYTQSEDDNALVSGVAGDTYALGYSGLAYFEENAEKLKLVAIDSGSGCVAPSAETVNDGTYAPLSRPLFVYPSVEALRTKAQVRAFFEYYLANVGQFVSEVGYVEAPAPIIAAAREALAAASK